MGPPQEIACVTTHSPEETHSLGAAIGSSTQAGDIFLLTGELGAGKTCLTQGIAWGLGVKEQAFSPSFVLVREYKGRLPLYHIDLYRLERLEEIADLGLDDYFIGKGVCVIEWADRGLRLLPSDHVLVEIQYSADTERRMNLTANGDRYAGRLSTIMSLTETLSWNCRSIPQRK